MNRRRRRAGRQARETKNSGGERPRGRGSPAGEEAAEAAHLYSNLPRARGREVDLAIAACAITWNAELWTLNLGDFDDIPGLRVSLPG